MPTPPSLLWALTLAAIPAAAVVWCVWAIARTPREAERDTTCRAATDTAQQRYNRRHA